GGIVRCFLSGICGSAEEQHDCQTDGTKHRRTRPCEAPSLVRIGKGGRLPRSGRCGGNMSYDLVIKNGTVIDGSGAPRYRADVAVAGGRIAAIGRVDGKAGRRIDAEGHVVTPG